MGKIISWQKYNMEKQIYTVEVNEDGTFWYKDSKCTILHRIDTQQLNGQMEIKNIIKMD